MFDRLLRSGNMRAAAFECCKRISACVWLYPHSVCIVWIILGETEFGEGVGDKKIYFPAGNHAPNTILYVCTIQNWHGHQFCWILQILFFHRHLLKDGRDACRGNEVWRAGILADGEDEGGVNNRMEGAWKTQMPLLYRWRKSYTLIQGV